jgi:hypothetical protein
MAGDLIIPIYVDTNSLLDLLASIEGGFSTVEKITTQSAEMKGIDRSVSAETGTEFGIPNILSILKLNIGYGAKWGKSDESRSERETERYHTYGSLFFRLREYLDSNDLIKRLDVNGTQWENLRPSDFVEIHGIFRPNPLANSLGILNRLVGIGQVFASVSNVPKAKEQPKRQLSDQEREQQRAARKLAEAEGEKTRESLKQMEQISKFLQGTLHDLESEEIRKFVVDVVSSNECKAVILLAIPYLRDKTMTEISHREFKLLGKVVRKIDNDSSEHIDLLLGTGLGGIGKEMQSQLVGLFENMPGMSLPDVQTEISGPALEVIPIAIYV